VVLGGGRRDDWDGVDFASLSQSGEQIAQWVDRAAVVVQGAQNRPQLPSALMHPMGARGVGDVAETIRGDGSCVAAVKVLPLWVFQHDRGLVLGDEQTHLDHLLKGVLPLVAGASPFLAKHEQGMRVHV
jgi:hypothetical protein